MPPIMPMGLPVAALGSIATPPPSSILPPAASALDQAMAATLASLAPSTPTGTLRSHLYVYLLSFQEGYLLDFPTLLWCIVVFFPMLITWEKI